MCGRYTITYDTTGILNDLDLIMADFDWEPRYNISPTQRVPVILNESPKALNLLRWGLVPSWAKDLKIGTRMINARGETLTEKPAFRQAYQKRRCLVPATGFYEWKATPLGKIPHHIRLQEDRLLTFAGLWEEWKDSEGRPWRTFTIITTTPNPTMAEIHDRMPVVIPPADRAIWLSPKTHPHLLSSLIHPLPDGLLRADPVSNQVNNARNEGPELLGPRGTLF